MFTVGGTTVATGSLVQAVVLDVAVAERLVDLSLKPEFFGESRGRSLKNQSHKVIKFSAFHLGSLFNF